MIKYENQSAFELDSSHAVIIRYLSHSPPQRLFNSTCENHVKRKSGASATKRSVLGTKVAVLGMCNNNNGSDSREQNLCSDTNVICRFYQEVEQSWELLRVQTSLSQDWNYKILKID